MRTKILFAVAALWISSAFGAGAASGLCLVRESEQQAQSEWTAFVFEGYEQYGQTMVFHIHGRPDATILRKQIGLVVDLIDFSDATLVVPEDFALVTTKRQQLETLSKKCTKASGVLTKISDGYKTGEASFAAGKVMGGIFLSVKSLRFQRSG